MEKSIFIATVKLAIEADNETEACDSITGCLTENLMMSEAIIDWEYCPDEKGVITGPVFKGILNAPFEEGELFR